MVEFNTGYIMSMDRDYGEAKIEDNSTNDVGVTPIKDIGFSVPLGIAAANVQGVAAKIRTGARLIELQFGGAGRGNRQQQTPGMYGRRARRAMEELSRANEVDFTTHASSSIMGLSGMDQQGNFSKQSRKFAVDEIRRAIDFASDVARGGSVVVHTGEFQRPISEEQWAVDPNTGKQLFRNYEEESERAVFRVVDERSGQIAIQARKNQRVARAIWLKAKPGETYYDDDGNERVAKEGEDVFINYHHKKIKWLEERVPEFNAETGRFNVEYWDWDRFKEEAKVRTQEAKKYWRENKNKPENIWKNSIYYQFRNANTEDEINIDPEEAYVQATIETNAANAKGWALYYGGKHDGLIDKETKLLKALELYKKIEEGVSPEEEWKIKREVNDSARFIQPGILPNDSKKTTELINEALREVRKEIEQGREASTAQEQQAADSYEQMRHVVSHRRYALKEAYGSYADAGIHAMVKSDQLAKMGKLKNPLFISMENIFPESYGGHPDELISLIEGSRNTMTKKLLEKGYTEQQAKQKAETHIKGLLDTGHLNMWRKYWVGDKNLPPEENDKKFNDWMLQKVEVMAKKKIIGHLHLVDNLGYQDEHLSPGEGNTPVKQIVEIMKKNGFNGKMIVEPGADATTDISDFHGLMKTWRLFGSSIYGIGSGTGGLGRQRSWGDVQYGYLGRAEPPYFTFGKYSPSEDWTLWSGVPME